MALKTVKVKRNADGTYTVRVGRAVEHFSDYHDRARLFETIKWSILSKGVKINDEMLEEMIFDEQ